MCRNVTVSSRSAIQHSLSAWADFASKLITTVTVTETKNPVKAHVALLRHVLTNTLEHDDAPRQHDHGVHILADVFDTRSAQPQSPLNAWLGNSVKPGRQKPTDSEMLSIRAKSLSICCTMLTSVINLTFASSTQNFELATNQFVKKSTHEKLELSTTIRCRGNGP